MADDDGHDRTSKDFTLTDMEWAQRTGYEQGIKDALDIIEMGGTPQLIRDRLLNRPLRRGDG